LPFGKLVATPPRVLLEVLSSLCSFANTDSCAGGGFAGFAGTPEGDGPGDTAVRTLSRTTSRCGFSGLATRCFGAWMVMLGSELPAEGVCDIAVPPRPHNNAIDRIATAAGATRLDDILMRRSSKSGH
jgi:hypothetical protein